MGVGELLLPEPTCIVGRPSDQCAGTNAHTHFYANLYRQRDSDRYTDSPRATAG
jgi:hypothetical protein